MNDLGIETAETAREGSSYSEPGKIPEKPK